MSRTICRARAVSRLRRAIPRYPLQEIEMRTTLIIAALAAAVAGCTTTPTAPPAVELPAPTAGDLKLERWWTSFDEPPLTTLVDEALANNLDLQAAIARVESARAQVKL